MSDSKIQKRIRYFIGDDIRSENDKPMIFGLCAGDTVQLGLTAEQPDPTSEAPIMLPSLAILASFIGYGAGTKESIKAEASLYMPDGRAVFEHHDLMGGIESASHAQKSDINLIIKFVPFTIYHLGQYRLAIQLNGTKYEYKFNISRAFPYQSKEGLNK